MTCKSHIFFTTMFIIIHISSEFGNYNPKRHPRVFGNGITMRLLDTRNKKLQQNIVLFHNYFRSKVKPQAANMLRMKWHKGAARAAQRWASACTFLTHDNVTGRHIENYGACGQNIFVSTHKVLWFFAIQTWWLEKDLFTFGRPNPNLMTIGHYTQMVWASTHEVGCGVAECTSHGNYNQFGRKVFYNYVCNYCPIGNRPGRLARPYKRGKPCNLCKRHCGRNKLCLNPCKAADQFTNCRDLFRRFPAWLCNSHQTEEGRNRRKNCLATCTCKHKIHD
ncbi:unnamed protein product [Psylliodes chrysocephalus]|uniref:ShKT domain-containing protein n=1 Tax=Psylliodes chrysocephalus TaxID=3402493 RepID=A0A9P0D0D0_9CUCU|nr:unnamed protein product [Psylliodes chrysocephala]